ncbi:beta strand repeat-containing protein [Stagnihabitans tardus]|uniref:Calcium-binding protein n=1 Tax=Stagnihabitans tardus TaxID=2699202 RepID=A0AAE4Y9S8_9RHOB|nr:calcium-binding protein [Stagnihabitans tardus]NBZ88693.1 hypothetical protein [Stagnihabitans tardus]
MVERTGGAGNDVLDGSQVDDVLVGLGGDDLLRGLGGNDLLVDTMGLASTIEGGGGNDTLAIGNTTLAGSLGGGSGEDVLRLGTAGLWALTLQSIEVLEVSGVVTARADQFEAFDQIRKASGDQSSLVRLQLAAPQGLALLNLTDELSAGGGLRAVALGGSGLGDQVTLGGGDDTAEGFGGDDSLTGGTGNDWIDGGLGADQLDGGAGDDTLIGDEGEDQLLGGGGNDLLRDTSGVTAALYGGGGDDLIQIASARFLGGTISGGTGIDRLAPSVVDLSPLTLEGIEVLELTMGISGRAAQFDGFDTIQIAGLPGARVSLTLTASGADSVLDLSDELAGRSLWLLGSADNETLVAGALDDRVEGGLGRDSIAGGAGADWLSGGQGDDSLSGGTEADTLVGGLGSDVLTGGAGDDLLQDNELLAGAIYGGEGNDRVEIFGPGTGTLAGGTGVDVLANASATSGVDISGLALSGFEVLETRGQPIRLTASELGGFATIRTGATPGTVFLWLATADAAVDLAPRLTDGLRVWGSVITGSGLADTVTGGAGNDTIAGGNGDDLLSGGLGRNALSGGNGVNTLTYQAFDRGVSVSLLGARADYLGGGDTISGFRIVLGSGLDDSLGGDSAENTLRGGAGNDVIRGLGGADLIEGGTGDDTLEGGLGPDRFLMGAGFGADRIEGFVPGQDIIDLSAFDIYFEELSLTTTGADTEVLLPTGERILLAGLTEVQALAFDFGSHAARRFDGTAGADLASASGLAGFAGIAAAIGDGTGDSFYGGAGADTVQAGPGNDSIFGGADADSLSGGAGADSLAGGAGDDLLLGGAGADTLLGDGNNDTIRGEMGDVVDGGNGIDLFDGSEAGALTLTLGLDVLGIEDLLGSGFDDAITGDALANRLDGGAGNDSLSGGAGDDTLTGGLGVDWLDGGAGNDLILAEAQDIVTGGAGIDTVLAAESVTLSADVENLTLTGTALSGTGNGLANVLQGNALDNILTGGKGSDTYIVQNAGDQVVEVTGEGNDTVNAWVSYSLDGVLAVENLTLLGSGDLAATGNSQANRLTGNSGANRLEGGIGNDTLTGGGGADVFVFSGERGADQVTDLSLAEGDRIDLSALTGGVAQSSWVTVQGGDVRIDLTANASVLVLGATLSDVLASVIW